ncbi:uncharacterized protein LOC121419771 [Lytechinus variegatus]|uniref:uncharacterized protein LOC121419771 n=1 Tax=Lytechinus variegatus TaxID=7654 RepID=UPI001BB24065|nr:uncharacterized protein LOC121419771 [Lytechinus variegatus]
MARIVFSQIMVFACLCHLVQLSNAQILLADRGSILFAPIPRPVKENNIFDAEFRRISLRESSVITSMDYDPFDRMVYYVDVTYKVVERNNLNGTARQQLQYSYIVPNSVGVDSVGRRVYYTISNQATIYYRDLGDLAVTYELPSTTFPSSSSHTTIAVDGLASYLLYTAFGYAQLISYRLGSQPVETRSLLSARTSAFTIEPCKTTDVNSSARVYYYKTFSKELGYANTFQTWNRTIQRLPDVASVNSGMAKYGNKLFFVDVVNFLKRRLIEYDTKASSLKIHNTVTVKLDTGGNSTITPDGIRVLNIKYTEPVSIEDCPMNISVKINSSSIYDTRQVSWTEPSLNAWSNCATLEFLGPGTNGGNFSKGVYNISYEASDLNGNTDTCSFTVTVEGEPDDDLSTEASPSSSPSRPSNDSTTDTSGSGGGDGNAPCGNGAKVSCTFIHFFYLVALLVTVFN